MRRAGGGEAKQNKFNANVKRARYTPKLRLEEITSKYCIYVSLFYALRELVGERKKIQIHSRKNASRDGSLDR